MKKLELKAGIQQYPDYTVNRARLNATLLDCYPQAEHRREINVILAVYESGVLPEFQGKNSLTPFETASLCAQPENEYGISGEYAAEGFRIVGIISDVMEGEEQKTLDYAADLVEQTGAAYPHLLLNKSLYDALLTDVTAVPTTFFIDENGMILDTVIGSMDKSAWEEIINGLLEK